MARVKSISDRPAKAKCKEWLESVGFHDVRPARNSSCDIVAEKDGKVYYIEIKYSSKEKGKFFGTVMLTEMHQAISNKDNYLFLICRGKGSDINDWVFKLINVEEFMKCCILTTPILLYQLDVKDDFELIAPRFTKITTKASDKLVTQMWNDFQNWKGK